METQDGKALRDGHFRRPRLVVRAIKDESSPQEEGPPESFDLASGSGLGKTAADENGPGSLMPPGLLAQPSITRERSAGRRRRGCRGERATSPAAFFSSRSLGRLSQTTIIHSGT